MIRNYTAYDHREICGPVPPIIIIWRALIGEKDRLQVVAAWWQHAALSRWPNFRFLLTRSSSSPWSTSIPAACICDTQGTQESSADHERCHYCNLLLQQTPGSWARSALEVLEMHKGKAGKQRRSAFCLKMQQPCRPGGAQQPYSEKGEFPCLLVQISF